MIIQYIHVSAFNPLLQETHEAEVAVIEMRFKNAQQKLEQDACALMEKKVNSLVAVVKC